MSLATNVQDLATRVATEAKALRTLINGNSPDLSALTTTAKGNLVAAVNEVVAAVADASGIDDGAISTTTSWSSQKTREEIDSAVAGVDVTDVIDDTVEANTSVWSSTKTASEIDGAIAAIDFPDVINDAAASTTTAYSSSKTDAQIAAAVGGVDLTDLINDSVASASTVYSSSKTDAQIAARVAAVIDTAPGALDTLNELAAALGDDPNFATTINTALGNRVRFDAAQTLTGPQQAQARANIDAASATAVGDTTIDFVSVFEAGLT